MRSRLESGEWVRANLAIVLRNSSRSSQLRVGATLAAKLGFRSGSIRGYLFICSWVSYLTSNRSNFCCRARRDPTNSDCPAVTQSSRQQVPPMRKSDLVVGIVCILFCIVVGSHRNHDTYVLVSLVESRLNANDNNIIC